MSLASAISIRWLLVDSMCFGLVSVDAARLAGVGMLYLEGRQAAAGQAEERKRDEVAAELRRTESEETVAATLEAMRAKATERAMRHHQMAVSTPEGAAAYRERVECYAAAAVVYGGLLAEPLARQLDNIPAVQLLDIGAPCPALRPDADDGSTEPKPTKLVRCDRPESITDALALLKEMGSRGEVPMWGLPPEVIEVIGGQAARLAGGRAATVAGFRALAR